MKQATVFELQPASSGQFHQCFTKQLLSMQILKAQKNTDDLTVFLSFWDIFASKSL